MTGSDTGLMVRKDLLKEVTLELEINKKVQTEMIDPGESVSRWMD